MMDLFSARSHLPSSTQGKPLTQITFLPVPHSRQCLPHPCPPSRLIIPKTLSPWEGPVCLFMDKDLPDEARGHSQENLLHPSAFRPQEVIIKDQHTAFFLKPSIKYTKLNIHKMIQGSIFLPGRRQSLPFLQHVPIINTLQCWTLSLE